MLFKIHNITIKTITKTLEDGKYNNGSVVSRTIKGNIQDFELDELLLEEFGGKVKKACLVVSPDLVEVDEFVVFNSEDYRIMKVANYSNQPVVKKGSFQAVGVVFDE